jgi:mono/diheme cytochrome c family protein
MLSHHRSLAGFGYLAAALLTVGALTAPALAQVQLAPMATGAKPPAAAPEAKATDGTEKPATYTSAQADRGHQLYTQNCVDCHGTTLDNGEFGGPPLKGNSFRDTYFGTTADALFGFMSSAMPPDRPGQLPAQQYADIMAYIMSANGVAPGSAELPADLDALGSLTLQ